MTNLYAELGEDFARRRHDQVARTLQRIANQPGSHGVRAQSAALCAFAASRGYEDRCRRYFSCRRFLTGSRY